MKYKYEYDGRCYIECPSKTLESSTQPYLCEFFDCEHYYNFTQKGCIDEIPDGYFLNSSTGKTIDKCHPNCKTCMKKEIPENNNCKSCLNNLNYSFFFGGDCISQCPEDYYIDKDDSSQKICICPDIRCSECSYESLDSKLCISCNENQSYYPIIYDYKNYYPYE